MKYGQCDPRRTREGSKKKSVPLWLLDTKYTSRYNSREQEPVLRLNDTMVYTPKNTVFVYFEFSLHT